MTTIPAEIIIVALALEHPAGVIQIAQCPVSINEHQVANDETIVRLASDGVAACHPGKSIIATCVLRIPKSKEVKEMQEDNQAMRRTLWRYGVGTVGIALPDGGSRIISCRPEGE